MSLPLTKGWLLGICLTFIVLLATVRGVSVHAGRLQTDLVVAQTQARASLAQYQLARREADSLKALLPRILAQAVAAAAPHDRAVHRTQTAEAALDSTRDAGVREAHGTVAPDSLRGVIERMATAETLFISRVHQERDSVNARLQAEMNTRAALERTVAAQSLALAAADGALADKGKVIDAMLRTKPGVLPRAVRGLAITGAASACGAIGWILGGPIGLVAGAAGCGAAAGIFSP